MRIEHSAKLALLMVMSRGAAKRELPEAGAARILASAMTDLEPKRVVLSIAEAYKRLAVRAELREPQPLIDNASFGPEALVIGEAFDEAWTEIADNYSTVPIEREAAQVKLATALLSVASEGSRDPRALKTAALERMKVN
jgi:hypothetical protein